VVSQQNADADTLQLICHGNIFWLSTLCFI